MHAFGSAKNGLANVYIKGACFDTSSEANSVMFGSVAAKFTVKTGSIIVASPPAQAAGTVDVTVASPDGGTSKLTAGDKYTFYAPVIHQIGPDNGSTAGGNTVVIRGSNLASGATPGVTFGGVASTSVTVSSSRVIHAVVPASAGGPGGVGKVSVVVTTVEGASSGSNTYKYLYTA